MLAFVRGSRARIEGLSNRVGSTLGLFAGLTVPSWNDGDRIAWQLPRAGDLPPRSQRQRAARAMRTQPALLDGGVAVMVHGWIDNCAELAKQLDCDPGNLALIYALAVRRWGDSADERVQGTYCTIYDDPGAPGLRLARSAVSAPPLYYMTDAESVAAASVPRVLEAMGLPRDLNRQRIAESLYFNLTEEQSYLQGCFKVPYGTIVHVGTRSTRKVRFHDPLAVVPLPKASAADYLAEADRLLTEASRLYFASAREPGILLTGGLDSSNIAARILRTLPPGRRLKSFTYVPLEGHGQPSIPGGLVDEGPAVRAFAAMHPQIEPYFVDNHQFEFDHRLEDMYLAMGTGTVNLATLFRYHGIYTAARAQGCDMILSADYGNSTFSSSGSWGHAEYLRRGQWRQLWRALRKDRHHPGSLAWRFLAHAVVPQLPDVLWRAAMRLRGHDTQPINLAVSALRPEALAEFDVEGRAARAGTKYVRPLSGWRKDLVQDNFGRGDVEGSDMCQGFEQLYEVSVRDPATYRPLVDFCLGLPTSMFLHDGETRWLARQLGRGLLPEAQRTMPGHGQHNSDWHKRLTPRLDDMRRELAAIKTDPILAAMIDTDLLEYNLDNWPAEQSVADDVFYPHAFRLPRAIAMGRYIRFMTARNTP